MGVNANGTAAKRIASKAPPKKVAATPVAKSGKRQSTMGEKLVKRAHRRLAKAAPALTLEQAKAALTDYAVVDLLVAAEAKYFELCWYWRAGRLSAAQRAMSPEAIKGTTIEKLLEIEKKYPEEVKEMDGKDASWTNGFNNGCLAMTRLALGRLEGGAIWDMERDIFPNLDT